jgi:hypothetical protein
MLKAFYILFIVSLVSVANASDSDATISVTVSGHSAVSLSKVLRSHGYKNRTASFECFYSGDGDICGIFPNRSENTQGSYISIDTADQVEDAISSAHKLDPSVSKGFYADVSCPQVNNRPLKCSVKIDLMN